MFIPGISQWFHSRWLWKPAAVAAPSLYCHFGPKLQKNKKTSYYQIALKDGQRRDKASQPHLAKPAKFNKIDSVAKMPLCLTHRPSPFAPKRELLRTSDSERGPGWCERVQAPDWLARARASEAAPGWLATWRVRARASTDRTSQETSVYRKRGAA